ncbi:peptidase associated/transthyretin-like domain-containing protein [Carboxylicivirga linearis]|uniref:Carboxypeptidase-like regulatory domain-containing protein n=1 Tax=Carboxylicivirga linearis TaxID=1628157 RepID=A0ABS5JPT8_9BACT|nr:hypothetical protein [Carboxylicivirga linearis]MBS2096842.1 hypothetical protein [Carboxylicivirga linearis]
MRINLLFTLIYILLFLSIQINAQHKYENWIHGRVVDAKSNEPIPNTQVGSYKRSLMFACDSLGTFKVNFPAGDSIKVLALGYISKIIYLDSLLNQDSEIKIIKLQPIHYELDEVNVSAFKEYHQFTDKLVEIREKQKELDPSFRNTKPFDSLAHARPIYNEKPPIIAAIFQPVNFIYYYASPKERQRVKSLKQVQEDKIRSRLTRELVQKITSFEGQELDNFLIYCNLNISLNEGDNETSITNKVMYLYKQYQNESNQ